MKPGRLLARFIGVIRPEAHAMRLALIAAASFAALGLAACSKPAETSDAASTPAPIESATPSAQATTGAGGAMTGPTDPNPGGAGATTGATPGDPSGAMGSTSQTPDLPGGPPPIAPPQE